MSLTINQQAILSTLVAFERSGLVGISTGGVVDMFNAGSVDTVAKTLHRLRRDKFVVAKNVGGKGTQARYSWRLSAKGKKVFS